MQKKLILSLISAARLEMAGKWKTTVGLYVESCYMIVQSEVLTEKLALTEQIDGQMLFFKKQNKSQIAHLNVATLGTEGVTWFCEL